MIRAYDIGLYDWGFYNGEDDQGEEDGMPTLKAIVQEMIRRAPGDSLGRSVGITSLTTTTAVCSSMATGTVAAQKFINKWLWRPDTGTAADRVRVCTNFTSSTGTFTHAGTNYADTTATDESLLVLEYDPLYYWDAIQIALERAKRIDRSILPTLANNRYYPLPSTMGWIEEPQNVKRVCLSQAPWLSNNRFLQAWSSYQSSALGTPGPDYFTLGGSGATLVRGTTYVRRGQYSAELTRVGTDCTMGQTIDLQLTGVADDDLVGETVMVVGVGLATAASRLRVAVAAGATTGNSSYHTGGSTWEELSASITVPATASSITFRAEVNTGNSTGYISELYLIRGSSLTDAIRRGQYEESLLNRDDYEWEQTPAGIMLVLNNSVARDQQLVLYSERSYSRFTQSRIDAGTADLDSTDCPLELVATGAIARLYEGLAQRPGEDATRYRALASEFDKRFQQLALAHRGGVIRPHESPIPPPQFAAPAGRW